MSRIAVFLATCAYIGYAPVAPGTFGSAAGLLVYLALRAAGVWWAEPVAIVAIFVIGCWAGTVAESYFGGEDPGTVVLDEVVGMLITIAFIPVTLTGALVGFLVFRLLDIVKPWPARRFEAMHGGLGIMADDAMAGVYGNLLMRVLILLAPGWLA